ncbi:N-acetylneuraminate synthase family protein [Bacteriovoracales bacterium]|nr:N-acetylneuraminate synthase family protein [Bacteriovoracales bacterium]
MSVFIIAEIGINHNGDVDQAKKLIDVASVSGANAVKFQKRTLDIVYTKEELAKARKHPYGTTNGDLKKRLEFDKDDYKEIDRYCKEKKIHWFASAWDLESQKFLREFDCKYNKVASAMLTDLDLLELIAEEKRHTFISTGMSTIEEIERAVAVFEKHNCPYELMHCNSTYPMPVEEANLRTMETLRKKFNCGVGYSGHETGLAVSYAAAALGATSLERHITLDRAMFGSDQSASIEPMGFMQLCGAVRNIEKSLGDGVKRVYSGEEAAKAKLRKQ